MKRSEAYRILESIETLLNVNVSTPSLNVELNMWGLGFSEESNAKLMEKCITGINEMYNDVCDMVDYIIDKEEYDLAKRVSKISDNINLILNSLYNERPDINYQHIKTLILLKKEVNLLDSLSKQKEEKINRPQSENNNGGEEAKKIRLKEVCRLLNDPHNNIECPNKILDFIRTQIKTNERLINGVEFIDYIKSNIFIDDSGLNIYGRGNPLLDKNRMDNLFELLEKLRDELSNVDCIRHCKVENNEETASTLNLPAELNNEQARKYFAKAIEKGYMEVSSNGYRWIFGGNRGQARLGYFCNKIYAQPRPINKLEKWFDVQKLSASISIADIEPTRADVIKWRKEIDDNIFNN